MVKYSKLGKLQQGQQVKWNGQHFHVVHQHVDKDTAAVIMTADEDGIKRKGQRVSVSRYYIKLVNFRFEFLARLAWWSWLVMYLIGRKVAMRESNNRIYNPQRGYIE